MFQNSTTQWIVGIVISLAGILIGRYSSKTRKDLSYEREIWPLIEDEVGSQLQVHFNNELVENVAIVVVTLSYKGTEPIRSDDFEPAIAFDFHDASRVLDAEVLNSKPTNMNPIVKIDSDTRVQLEPVLFNDGNSMTIKMLVENGRRVPAVDGRIAGGNLRDGLAYVARNTKIINFMATHAGRLAITFLLLALVPVGLNLTFGFPSPGVLILFIGTSLGPFLMMSFIWILERTMDDD